MKTLFFLFIASDDRNKTTIKDSTIDKLPIVVGVGVSILAVLIVCIIFVCYYWILRNDHQPIQECTPRQENVRLSEDGQAIDAV